MAGVSRKKKQYIPLEGEEYIDEDNYDEDNPLGLPKYESKADERRRLNKKTKKKVIRLPQHDVDAVLAYTPEPFPPAVAEQFPEAVALKERAEKINLDRQEWIRQQYEAKGYVEYEAEVTDSEGGDGEEKEEKLETETEKKRRVLRGVLEEEDGGGSGRE